MNAGADWKFLHIRLSVQHHKPCCGQIHQNLGQHLCEGCQESLWTPFEKLNWTERFHSLYYEFIIYPDVSRVNMWKTKLIQPETFLLQGF